MKSDETKDTGLNFDWGIGFDWNIGLDWDLTTPPAQDDEPKPVKVKTAASGRKMT